MANVLEAYEDMNLQQYVDIDVYKLVLNNPDNQEIKDGLAKLSEEIEGSFVELQLWAKGELYDLESVLAAINLRETLVKKTAALKKKIIKPGQDSELQPLDKNAEDKKEQSESKPSAKAEEIEYQLKLINLMTVHLGSKVTEHYKHEKLMGYKRMIKKFFECEAQKHKKLRSFWINAMEKMSGEVEDLE